MNWLVIAVVLVAIIALVVLKLVQKQGVQPAEYPYRKIDILFTPAERSFLDVLNQATGENTQIFGKVRVADVIAPKKGMPRSDWQKAFNKISGKHFDFLLCDKKDLSALCAIELNDSSHNSKKRKDRDIFIEGACWSANVPLIQFAARATYNISEIQNSLNAFLPVSVVPKPANESERQLSSINQLAAKNYVLNVQSLWLRRLLKRGRMPVMNFGHVVHFPNAGILKR